jgi:two-component system sensor histidine kinase/response regulator
MRDSRAFVWFSTRDGVSRFDGLRFVTYGTEDGLPDPTVNATIERCDGSYWIATNGGGVCRLDPGTKSATTDSSPDRRLFRIYPVGTSTKTNRVNTLFEDHTGVLWAGTDGGLFRLQPRGDGWIFHQVPLDLPGSPGEEFSVGAIAEGVDGTLWFGTSKGLVRYRRDGTHAPALHRPTRAVRR